MARHILSIAALIALNTIVPSLALADQRPLTGEDAPLEYASPLRPPPVAPKRPPRPAELTIYEEPKWPCVSERGHPKLSIQAPINVCMSADFTLDSNVHLRHPGYCEGGTRKPYIAIYPSTDCTGEHTHPDWYDRPFATVGPGHCLSTVLWKKMDITPTEGQFSMAFRCDDLDAPLTETIAMSMPEYIKPEPKPAPPRPVTASVSDSACYIPGIGMAGAPRFIFQRPEPDTCVNVEPKHKLKIYRNALCPDGTEARFARFKGKSCKGKPVELKEVDSNMMATNGPGSCIEMGGNKASSYAFWCTGKLKSKKPKEALFPEDGEGVRIVYGNGGSFRSKSGGRS